MTSIGTPNDLSFIDAPNPSDVELSCILTLNPSALELSFMGAPNPSATEHLSLFLDPIFEPF